MSPSHISPLNWLAALLLLAFPAVATAQCDKVSDRCQVELVDFLTDGQYYHAQVTEGQSARFKITFYEGFTYRIVACTDDKQGHIRYSIYDGSKREVFSNAEVPDGTGWDFEIGATEEFTIKASLSKGAGCIVLCVGYDDTMFMDDDDLTEEDDPFFEDELTDEDYGLDEGDGTR